MFFGGIDFSIEVRQVFHNEQNVCTGVGSLWKRAENLGVHSVLLSIIRRFAANLFFHLWLILSEE